MYCPSTTSQRLLLAVAFIQGLLALSIEGYVLVTVEVDLDPAAYQVFSGHAVPMYFSLFIFAFVHEIVIVYDALRLSNMIQIVGLCIYNILLLVYAIVQPLHVKKALDTLSASLVMGERPILPLGLHTWERVSLALMAVVLVQVVATVVTCFLAYKLHFEFAWVMYRVLHAELSMRRRLLTFQAPQIYMALIKFSVFFLLGFLVQVAVLMVSQADPEFGLSISGIFVTLFVVWMAIKFALEEKKIGTTLVILAYLGAAGYLAYKLSVFYNSGNYALVVFTAITLVIICCTVVMAICCMSNFHKGLVVYITPQQKVMENDVPLRYAQNTSYRLESLRMDLD
ncbi:uncharacterized protein LY79DRAFT_572064 [Colletotrichum navitas]|uniref:Uncharacterized protein n=1 Tax=Colletotrichum navitas TaxID=681940 RepID=A0AAD8PLL0_9PEZI|nr:uncharacterized protein LY79DRAFT_572064 [Colletotrichum navitas]KAK1569363.1 hypothetical protein LY79DRAFT_572064 [Colletotrichum navitas]